MTDEEELKWWREEVLPRFRVGHEPVVGGSVKGWIFLSTHVNAPSSPVEAKEVPNNVAHDRVGDWDGDCG